MRRSMFIVACLGLLASVVWALADDGSLQWGLAILSLVMAVFASPWTPGGGDNWDSTFGGGDGGGAG